MKIPITIPVVFFDKETTSADKATARTVSLSMTKVFPDGTFETKSSLINPEIPIPESSTAIHGITNEMVASAPKFAQLAKSILRFIDGCVLSGYNIIEFDIPILWEEFFRAGIEWDTSALKVVDPCVIFKKKEERTLSAALKFYTGKELTDAHEAAADVTASIHVLNAQVQVYTDLAGMTLDQLAEYSKYDGPQKIDLAGAFVRSETGDILYGFGKWKGDPVKSQIGYLNWIINTSDYTQQTKIIATKIKEGKIV